MKLGFSHLWTVIDWRYFRRGH